MKHILFYASCLGLLSISASAQEVSPLQIIMAEGRKILEHPEYHERVAANEKFTSSLVSYISESAGFNDPLSGVSNMLRLELGDEIRLFTWQMPDTLYNYTRFGLVGVMKDDSVIITELKEVPDIENMQFKKLRAEQWYGAIYYTAIPESKKNPKFFTLLGFAPGKEVNEKFIEVLEIDKKGRPVFGAKVFHIDEFMDKTLNQPPMRLILKYSGDYAASVRWLQDEELIVMDHLAPPDVKLKGVYRMYGPDMSYDALRWDKKWWYLDEEVKFDSNQNIEIRPPDKPLDLPAGTPSKKDSRN